jgi:hypothetical protein
MTTIELMNQIFISEYNSIVYKSKHHYISFSLIAQGIEFLGRCLDDKHGFDWEENASQRDYSGKVFRKAIEKLFPAKYRKFAIKGSTFDLYKNLRCGLIHKLVPHSPIGLTHRKESKRFNTKHLQVVKDTKGKEIQLILICEDFYDDFVMAVNKVKEMVSNGELKHPKMGNHILYVPKPSI